MSDLALIVALLVAIYIIFYPMKVRTKWVRPELSIIELLFVIIVSYIIVTKLFS